MMNTMGSALRRGPQAARARLPGAIWLWRTGLACAGLMLVGGQWLHWRRSVSVVPTHFYQLQTDRMEDWKPLGGVWKISDRVIYNSSHERGAKLLAGSAAW